MTEKYNKLSEIFGDMGLDIVDYSSNQFGTLIAGLNSNIYGGNMYYGKLSKEQSEMSVRMAVSDRISSMALTRFKYENLPDTIKSSEIEALLYEYGFATITKIDGKLRVVPSTVTEIKPYYGTPTRVNVIMSEGSNINRTNGKDAVVMGNTSSYNSPYAELANWADQIVKLEMNRNNNNSRLSNPVIFNVAAEGTNTVDLEELHNSILDNEAYLMSAVNERGDSIDKEVTVLNTSEAYQGTALNFEIQKNWSRIADQLGINNVSRDTASGLSDSELTDGQESAHAAGLRAFYFRKEKVEEINKLFGTNISVDWFDNVAEQQAENDYVNNEDIEGNGE